MAQIFWGPHIEQKAYHFFLFSVCSFTSLLNWSLSFEHLALLSTGTIQLLQKLDSHTKKLSFPFLHIYRRPALSHKTLDSRWVPWAHERSWKLWQVSTVEYNKPWLPYASCLLSLVICFAKVMMERSSKEVSVRGQHGIQRCPLGSILHKWGLSEQMHPLLMAVLYSPSW